MLEVASKVPSSTGAQADAYRGRYLVSQGRAQSALRHAQIAEELSVSVRTVESHLYSAFAKLGITDRTQLSDALDQE